MQKMLNVLWKRHKIKLALHSSQWSSKQLKANWKKNRISLKWDISYIHHD